MEAGFARESITPALGAPLLGTGSAQQRRCTRVNDPVYVRALSVAHDHHQALILGLDLCFIGRGDAERLAGVLARELGLLPHQVMMNCSHTHSGPAVGAYADMFYAPPEHDYLRLLDDAVVRAARAAIADRRTVEVFSAMGRSTLPVNRRQRRGDIIENAPNPGGPVLESLPVCLLRDARGEPVCLLFAGNTHPVCMRDTSVSADYPGVAMARLDEHLGRPCSLFLQGAGCGNSRPGPLSLGRDWNFKSGWKETTIVGEQLAKETIAAMANLHGPLKPHVATAMVTAHFPFKPLGRADYEAVLAEKIEKLADHHTMPIDWYSELRRRWAKRQLLLLEQQAQPASVDIFVQGIQLAEGLRLLTLACEPMAEHGHAIEHAFGSAAGGTTGGTSGGGGGGVTFALGYSNGDGIYLATTAMLPEGGYEVDSYWEYGHPAPLAPGIEATLARAIEHVKAAGVR